ncbi:hypothetical protein GCM10010946_17870 [Undibacterium squillarum]|uniref:Uncharacterized protein n=1 Tax=Undibacterium squillarum TaxID=1131567 RepID=A0ABQ2XZD0_9BURK|nr:hypothetical protein GCM10010946_17870 [Undibacterium squillarum]
MVLAHFGRDSGHIVCPDNKKPDRLMHASGSGVVLLAAFITRPQSESQIGADVLNYTANAG